MERANASFELFKSGSNMPAKFLCNIIKFLVPLYDNKSALLKFNSIKNTKDKLASFEVEYGSSWDALMQVQLRKFQVKQQPAQDEAPNPTTNLQDLLHLEEDSVGRNSDGKDDNDEGQV